MIDRTVFKESARIDDYILRHVVPEITGSYDAKAMSFLNVGAAMLYRSNPELFQVAFESIIRVIRKTGGK